MINPLKIISWQAEKDVYLKQLADAGVHMPKTFYQDRTDPSEEAPSLEEFSEMLGGCDDIIIKPVDGNGGVGVLRLDPFKEEDESTYRWTLGGDSLLVQCFQKQIKTKGERGVIFVAGQVTHGVIKMPAKDEASFLVHEAYSGSTKIYEPSEEEATFAKNVAQTVKDIVGEYPAYMRVDMFYDNDDKLALMELASGTANLWMAENQKTADVLAEYLDGLLRDLEARTEERTDRGDAKSTADKSGNVHIDSSVHSEL